MRQKLRQFTWQQWLMPRSIDGIGLLLYLGLVGVYSYYTLNGFYTAPYPVLRIMVVLLALLVLAALDRLEYLYIVYLIGRVESKNRPQGITQEGDIVFHLVLFIGVFFIFYIAYLIRQERLSRMRTEKLLAELEDSHRQLQAYAVQVAELATTEERNRLARDIHDSLGHYLTVINVQLEKALTFRERNPEEADQAVRDSKRLASETLQEVHRSVGGRANVWS